MLPTKIMLIPTLVIIQSDLRPRDQTAPDASRSPSASAAADRCPPFAQRGVRRRPAVHRVPLGSRRLTEKSNSWTLLMTMVVTVYAHLLVALKRESVFIQTYLYAS